MKELKLKIDSLAVFSDIKNNKVIMALRRLLESIHTDGMVKAYGDFVAALYPHTSDLTDYISTLLAEDDNFYVKDTAAGREISSEIREAVSNEINVLQDIAAFTPLQINSGGVCLPKWTTHSVDLHADFEKKMSNISRQGYGIFAKYTFFRLSEGEVIPVAYPDYQPMSQLFGYERERDLVMKNTQALLEGKGAANMLLYGDAGTGKSSTIKAVTAQLAGEGLRIIEVKKNQLFQIPRLTEQLSANPLKFIIFIDDLSFGGNDDNFSALKATLEGSISGCGDNTVIYATSNRRHLIKERFGDRVGDELHLNDTMQETMSLASRFGLTVTFQKPDKEEYLDIVKSLAGEYGIQMEESKLFQLAEAHAIRKNGRSPRTAKQFIELLKIGIL
ncbi:MAG: ATP-binding protein [Clostridiales bacterium]|nr:ATP-binding protein [Clostridiales bacterium]